MVSTTITILRIPLTTLLLPIPASLTLLLQEGERQEGEGAGCSKGSATPAALAHQLARDPAGLLREA